MHLNVDPAKIHDQKINGEYLVLLDAEMLRDDLGVTSKLVRAKIMFQIGKLVEEPPAPPAPAVATTSPSPTKKANVKKGKRIGGGASKTVYDATVSRTHRWTP